MFCGSGRGKFTRSTESFNQHWEFKQHGEFNGAPRGGGSTEESWKHGGFTEHGERSGKHGVFNGRKMEDVQFYSILLCFYEAGKARIWNFFLAGTLKVS